LSTSQPLTDTTQNDSISIYEITGDNKLVDLPDDTRSKFLKEITVDFMKNFPREPNLEKISVLIKQMEFLNYTFQQAIDVITYFFQHYQYQNWVIGNVLSCLENVDKRLYNACQVMQMISYNKANKEDFQKITIKETNYFWDKRNGSLPNILLKYVVDGKSKMVVVFYNRKKGFCKCFESDMKECNESLKTENKIYYMPLNSFLNLSDDQKYEWILSETNSQIEPNEQKDLKDIIFESKNLGDSKKEDFFEKNSLYESIPEEYKSMAVIITIDGKNYFDVKRRDKDEIDKLIKEYHKVIE
jgi:hypothetical protein